MFRTYHGTIFPQVMKTKDGKELYVVYSYGLHFPMYACIGGSWYGNSDRYSSTTSKHQSCSRPRVSMTWVDTDSLKRLIREA